MHRRRESHLEQTLSNALHEREPEVVWYKDFLGKPGLHWCLSERLAILYMWMRFLVAMVTVNSNSIQWNDIYMHQWWHQIGPLCVWKKLWCLSLEVPLGHSGALCSLGPLCIHLIHNYWNLLCGRYYAGHRDTVINTSVIAIKEIGIWM